MGTINVNIWVDQHVHDHHGLDPAYTFQNLLSGNFEFNDINSYAIVVKNNIPLDGRNYGDTGDIWGAFHDWVKTNVGTGAQDSAHLLFDHSDRDGGVNGLSQYGTSVAIGDYLSKVDNYWPPRWAEADRGPGVDVGDCYRITAQEVGHDLGLCGSGKCDDGAHGCGFNYDDGYYSPSNWPGGSNDLSMTPLGEPNDFNVPNNCGYYGVDPADYSGKQYNDAYFFKHCAGDCLRNKWN